MYRIKDKIEHLIKLLTLFFLAIILYLNLYFVVRNGIAGGLFY